MNMETIMPYLCMGFVLLISLVAIVGAMALLGKIMHG